MAHRLDYSWLDLEYPRRGRQVWRKLIPLEGLLQDDYGKRLDCTLNASMNKALSADDTAVPDLGTLQSGFTTMDNTCVCCGAVIPEGRLVCWVCEHYGAEAPLREEVS